MLKVVVGEVNLGGVGATSATLLLWADSPNPDVAPPSVSFTKSGTYADNVAVSSSTWAKDSATLPPYNYKSTLTFVAQNTGSWPAGDNGSVAVNVVAGDTGVTIGTVTVTLTGKHKYSLPTTAVTISSL
jgi:hypothetical protein